MQEVEPALAEAGIRRVHPNEMTDRQSQAAEQVFANEIYPIFTPIAVSDAEDFPQLINQTLSVCVSSM